MNTSGVIFKSFRVGKNLSLAFVTKGIMSPAQLSKFERGSNDITTEKFFMILDRINITPEEFFLAKNNYSLSGLEKDLTKIRRYYGENNASKLKVLLAHELDKYHRSKLIYSKLNAICIKGYLNEVVPLEGFSPTSQEKKLICDYLLSVDDWSYYEILLFSNCMKSINLYTSISLAKEMTKRVTFYQDLLKHKRAIIQALINMLIICTEQSLFKESQYFKNVFSSLLKDESLLYERNVFLFAKGLLYFKLGENDHGISLMNTSLDVFKMLGCDNLFFNYKNYLNKLVN